MLQFWISIANTFSLVNCTTTCNGEIGFCNCNACAENEGDCDIHDECQEGLVCGSKNCPASLGFASIVDCCYKPTLGDEYFCTTDNPCDVDEGNCDSHNECQTNLRCDIENGCSAYLGLASDINCCSTECKFVYFVLFLFLWITFMLRFFSRNASPSNLQT